MLMQIHCIYLFRNVIKIYMMFSLSWLQQAKTKITSVFVRNYYSGNKPIFQQCTLQDGQMWIKKWQLLNFHIAISFEHLKNKLVKDLGFLLIFHFKRNTKCSHFWNLFSPQCMQWPLCFCCFGDSSVFSLLESPISIRPSKFQLTGPLLHNVLEEQNHIKLRVIS